MDKIIEKYKAKLSFLEMAINQTKHLLDEDEMDVLTDMRVLLTEFITDLTAIKALQTN